MNCGLKNQMQRFQFMNRRTFVKTSMKFAALFPLIQIVSPKIVSAFTKGEKLQLIQKTAFAMGSIITFDIYCSDRKHALQTIHEAVERIHELERILTVYSDESEIGKINLYGSKKEIPISSDTYQILQKAKEFNSISNGIFDVTVEPLMRLYGFRNQPEEVISFPSDRDLYELSESIGMKNLNIAQNYVSLNNHKTKIDLGGIGCGFALEEVKRIFYKNNLDNALINFSGDILALGSPQTEEKWSVQILDPRKTENSRIIHVSEKAVSTSGSYENRRSDSKRSWGHLINPKQLQPVEPVISATVVSESAINADILSTSLYFDQSLSQILKNKKLINDFVFI